LKKIDAWEKTLLINSAMKKYSLLFTLILIFSMAQTALAARYTWNGLVYTNTTVAEMIEAILATKPMPPPGAEFSWNGKLYNDQTVSEMITVITTTNPIPSIPSTKHIYPTQKSLFRIPAIALCKKIIVFDGIQPGFEDRAADYEQYKQEIITLTKTDPYFANTELIFCEKWVHLAGAVREAMAHVTTPYIFIHQHDFVLMNDFELNGVIATMEANPNVKYVRLAHPPNIHWLPSGDVDPVVIGPSFVPLMRHYG